MKLKEVKISELIPDDKKHNDQKAKVTNIEKVLFPNSGKIKKKKGVISVQIVDAELDPIICTVQEGAIVLDTEKCSYISLTLENLHTLIKAYQKHHLNPDRQSNE